MKNFPAKIVIMRTDRIGEVLLSTVLIDGIKKLYPRAKISFVTSMYSKDILSGRDDIAEIIIADIRKNSNWLLQAVKLAVVFKKRRFDYSIVLNANKILHLATFLAGIPVRIGYNRKWSVFLNKTIEDEREKGRKHEAEYAMDFARLLGLKNFEQPSPRLVCANASREKVKELLFKKGADLSQKLIVIHPASSNPAKMWEKTRYAELIKKLKSHSKWEIIVVGTREERSLAEEIIRAADENGFNVCGELNLKELAALLKRANVFVGNDSGPMHMAAALDVPVIAIFGRNIPGVGPKRWGPYGKIHKVFHMDVGCRKCYDRECPFGYKCLSAVTVDEVFAAVCQSVGADPSVRP